MTDITKDDVAARAARNVPGNPRELCRDFQEQPAPSAYWCGRCHWNRDLHESEVYRTAIAEELHRLRTQETPR